MIKHFSMTHFFILCTACHCSHDASVIDRISPLALVLANSTATNFAEGHSILCADSVPSFHFVIPWQTENNKIRTKTTNRTYIENCYNNSLGKNTVNFRYIGPNSIENPTVTKRIGRSRLCLLNFFVNSFQHYRLRQLRKFRQKRRARGGLKAGEPHH